MSLFDSFYKKYTIMNETTVDDPDGGWQAEFRARLNPYRELREV